MLANRPSGCSRSNPNPVFGVFRLADVPAFRYSEGMARPTPKFEAVEPRLLLASDSGSLFFDELGVVDLLGSEVRIAEYLAVDINQDGQTELVLATDDSQLVILQQDGGGVRVTDTFSLPGRAQQIRPASIGGDAMHDLLILTDQGVLPIISSSGAEQSFILFAEQPSIGAATSWSVDSGYFNEDAELDIVIGRENGIDVWFGRGDGSFGESVAYDTTEVSGPVYAAAGDHDGNGLDDLVVTSVNDYQIQLLPNDGTGIFEEQIDIHPEDPEFALFYLTQFVELHDLNSDGLDDLLVGLRLDVAGDFEGSYVHVAYSEGDGEFSMATQFGSTTFPESIQFDDFNGDGHEDVYLQSGDVVRFHSGVFDVFGNGDEQFFLGTGETGVFENRERTPQLELLSTDVAFSINQSDWWAETTFPTTIQQFRTTSLNPDLNLDREINVADVDALQAMVLNESVEDLSLDLDRDGVVDSDDVLCFVDEVFDTVAGDVNLDGRVGFNDFLALSGSYGSETAVTGGWSRGDFDSDGIVGLRDFLLLSSNFS